MTSRERVWATIRGKPVDRIASNFRAEAEVFGKLQRHLGCGSVEEVLKWAKSDFRDLSTLCNEGGYGGYSSFGWRDRELRDGSFEDIWGVRRRLVCYGDGVYMDIVHSPLKHAKTIDRKRSYRFPDPAGIYDFSTIPQVVDRFNGRFHRGEEYFTMIEGESLFDRCWALRGMEEFLIDLVCDEEGARFVIEGNHRFFTRYTRMLLESAGGKIDAIGMYNDLGNQRGMMISPALYRKYFKELQREYVRMVKEYGASIFYHSCGGITDILEDLIDIGIDILDPLQLNAMGLTPGELAVRCGDRIAFHGGISIQDLMVRSTPGQVEESVRELKQALGVYGKYVLSCSHLIQMDVPVENIEAIREQIG
jgi:uroporphyrinogen decarboxylase